jgi:hypothetical protein
MSNFCFCECCGKKRKLHKHFIDYEHAEFWCKECIAEDERIVKIIAEQGGHDEVIS